MKVETKGLLEAGIASEQGNSRKPNMDRAAFVQGPEPDLALAMVADGMGGHADGARASELVVETLRERCSADWPLDWPSFFREAFVSAHQRLASEVAEASQQGAMGSTLVAVAIQGTRGFVAHVGDSRATLFRGEFCFRLTSDHLEIVEHGLPRSDGALERVAENKAKGRSYSNILSRCLGAGSALSPDRVEVLPFEALHGDTIVLCSDGISEYVGEQEIWRVLCESSSAGESAKRIVARAVGVGSHDHCTALVLRVQAP